MLLLIVCQFFQFFNVYEFRGFITVHKVGVQEISAVSVQSIDYFGQVSQRVFIVPLKHVGHSVAVSLDENIVSAYRNENAFSGVLDNAHALVWEYGVAVALVGAFVEQHLVPYIVSLIFVII